MNKIFKPGQSKNVILLIAGFILFPTFAFGAVLYLEPASGEYQPGDTFVVNVRIDTEGECINAVEADLSFSQDIFKAVDFSRGQSIITLWTKTPEIKQELGQISFSGGVPGGYCGRIPGDPETSNLLGKIIFEIPGMMVGGPREGPAEIRFLETSQVLLNDGLGTLARLSTKGTDFKIVPQRTEPIEESWQEEIKNDTFPPEPFEIVVHKDRAIFEGKYFITFLTSDKQTGLDYYEIQEGIGNWKKAESPYLLEDQTLGSIIKVRATDKAGNERIAEYLPEAPKKFLPYWTIILVLLGAGIIVWVIIKITRKK